MIVFLSSTEISKTVGDVLRNKNWTRAMEEEIRAYRRRGLGIWCEDQREWDPLEIYWGFNLKDKVDDTLERSKATLVGNGYTQTYRYIKWKHLHQ